MTLRKEHKFQFQAYEIAKAAQTEASYHNERAKWWDREYQSAVEEAKKAGVTIREYDVTGGKRAQIVLDGSVQQRIDESQMKRERHGLAAEKFEIEAKCYGSQPDNRTFDLDGDDVMHWRLAGGEREA